MYLTLLPMPVIMPPRAPDLLAAFRQGHAAFYSVGCAGCHKPTWLLSNPTWTEQSEAQNSATRVVLDLRKDIRNGPPLRNRDAVIGALIRRARTQFALCDFSLPPEPADDDPMIDIYPTIQLEHVAFLYRLQRRIRGAALGTTIEALVETVVDIASMPVQPPLPADKLRLRSPRLAGRNS